MGLPVLLGWGKQSCSLIKTDGGDWNRAKLDEVQNNTFKGKHTNIRVAVQTELPKWSAALAELGNLPWKGNVELQDAIAFYIWEKCNCHEQVSGKFVTNGYILELSFEETTDKSKENYTKS